MAKVSFLIVLASITFFLAGVSVALPPDQGPFRSSFDGPSLIILGFTLLMFSFVDIWELIAK